MASVVNNSCLVVQGRRFERNNLSARSNRSLKENPGKSRSRSNTSLWSAKRDREEKRRAIENMKQLARLQDAKCSFDVIRWTNDEKRRQKLLDNMR